VWPLAATLSAGGGPLLFADATPSCGGDLLSGPGTLPLNTWSNVAVTLSGHTGTLYVDGQPVATNDMTVTPADLGATSQNWIGRSQFIANPTWRPPWTTSRSTTVPCPPPRSPRWPAGSPAPATPATSSTRRRL
jgi:hypothetical protein